MTAREAGFAELLDRLGFTPTAAVTICHAQPGGTFCAEWTMAADAPEVADRYADICNVWFNVNGLWDRRVGRGRTEDVTRFACVYAELDIKPGGMPNVDAAVQVIAALSGMLGTKPVAVVKSGHGLHAYWPIDPEDPAVQLTDDTRPVAVALATRFGRLVGHVAQLHGGHADSVFDLARVLRVPGTVNRKGEPVPVSVDLAGGHPLTMAELDERLTEYGATERPGDRDVLGAVVTPVGGWQWAGDT